MWFSKSSLHIGLMIYTALMVPLFGFMNAVLSALFIYMAYVFAMLGKNIFDRQ